MENEVVKYNVDFVPENSGFISMPHYKEVSLTRGQAAMFELLGFGLREVESAAGGERSER